MQNLMTAVGFEKLEKKLAVLLKKRDHLVTEVEAARQEGDLSENFAYHQLKEQVAIVDGQIQMLQEKLSGAKLVKSNNGINGEIAIGSQITVQVGAVKKDFEIVGDGESNPIKGKISYQSPIGKALLGRKLGEKVTITTPGGEIDYEILAVR